MSKIDLAYTAGIVDGEGCISIAKKKEGKYIRYVLQVMVNSTDEWLPMWLKFAYGGNVCKRPLKNNNHNPVWQWQTVSRQAGNFLEIILPYLHLKKPQAEIGLKFQLRRRIGRGKSKTEFILDEADNILLKSIKHRRQI